jgi:hypothetical protein
LFFVFFVYSRVLLERRRSRSGSSTRGGERRGGLVAQRAVRPVMVVVLKPGGRSPEQIKQDYKRIFDDVLKQKK